MSEKTTPQALHNKAIYELIKEAQEKGNQEAVIHLRNELLDADGNHVKPVQPGNYSKPRFQI